MEAIFERIEQINGFLNGIVWGVPMLLLMIFTGIYLTVRSSFFQIRRVKHINKETLWAIFKKKSVTKTKDAKAISQFQALSTVLAATIGTGNIAGVATAITLGGPGAVFWMWVSAFFGMMTIYAENVLGIFYRKKNSRGEWSGGAMYYLEEGLKEKKRVWRFAKPLAVLFAAFCVLASFGIGNMTQVNSIADAVNTNFGVSPLTTGIILSVLTTLVILGGIKRIGKVTEKLVPFMALFYVLCALVILLFNIKQVPYVFKSIFESAFDFGAAAGGAGGYAAMRAISMGFKRGVFSNEAGLGSSVMVNSASDVKEPAVQGMWGIFEVFVDTIILCTLTAFILLSSPAKAVPFETAVKNVTVKPQYFRISGGEYSGEEAFHLIGTTPGETVVLASDTSAAQSEIQPVKVIFDGNEYLINTLKTEAKRQEDYIYSGIMSITGSYETDKSGNVLLSPDGQKTAKIKVEKVDGVSLVSYALSQRFGGFAGKLLTVAVVFFAFATVLGWSIYGMKSMEYLFGIKSVVVYKLIYILFIIFGCTMSLDMVWNVSDTLNGFMAIPNLIGVLLLSGTVIKITRNYTRRRIKRSGQGVKPMLSAYRKIQNAQEAELAAGDAEEKSF